MGLPCTIPGLLNKLYFLFLSWFWPLGSESEASARVTYPQFRMASREDKHLNVKSNQIDWK